MTPTRLSLSILVFAVAGCSGLESIDGNGGGESVARTSEALSPGAALGLTPVANANPKAPGVSSPNVLSPELIETPVAQGSNVLENPQTVATGGGTGVLIGNYGYMGDGPFVPVGNDVQSAMHDVEAQKTEPDKNTYLVLHHPQGADPDYDYGTHFMFQGHELGVSNALAQAGATGYITRINLDADGAHRITVIASTDMSGNPIPVIDGSTWDPFAQRLLFTAEAGSAGGVWQATLDFPSSVEDMSGSLGRGGYEGIQNDSLGNVWIVEDVGGAHAAATPHARTPNSFVYRFIPTRPDDLHRGKLQALQVVSVRTGQPIAFHGAAVDTLSDDVADLHTYGIVFTTHWVTIHDTGVDGTTPFDANALAKAALATPFKRPENGQFRPGSSFRQFFFDETGDTDANTEAGAAHGGLGAVLGLTLNAPGSDDGKLSLLYLGDIAHSGFDNCAFVSRNHIVFVEDAGDGLHTQRNALDSAYILDVTADYSNPANQPLRFLAEGRDASATLDSGLSGLPGFQNEGDNEITGMHVSNGDPTPFGLLGAQIPRPFHDGWRMFYTQQHGDNFTWEILSRQHDD